MDAFARFAWFLVAAAVGFAWVSAAKWSGAALEGYAHGVFGSLFLTALAAGGHDVRALYRFKSISRKLADQYQLTPAQLEDAERLAAAIITRDAEAAQGELDRPRPRPSSGRHKALTDRRPVTRPGDLPTRREGRR